MALVTLRSSGATLVVQYSSHNPHRRRFKRNDCTAAPLSRRWETSVANETTIEAASSTTPEPGADAGTVTDGAVFPSARLDTTGLLCPLPVLKTRKALAKLAPGQCLEVIATDPQSHADMTVLCDTQGHRLISCETGKGEAVGPAAGLTPFRFLIVRG
jgi:tRNA 2-thiouridine synthesizing protein A